MRNHSFASKMVQLNVVIIAFRPHSNISIHSLVRDDNVSENWLRNKHRHLNVHVQLYIRRTENKESLSFVGILVNIGCDLHVSSLLCLTNVVHGMLYVEVPPAIDLDFWFHVYVGIDTRKPVFGHGLRTTKAQTSLRIRFSRFCRVDVLLVRYLIFWSEHCSFQQRGL